MESLSSEWYIIKFIQAYPDPYRDHILYVSDFGLFNVDCAPHKHDPRLKRAVCFNYMSVQEAYQIITKYYDDHNWHPYIIEILKYDDELVCQTLNI
jgi:hypothetical protein